MRVVPVCSSLVLSSAVYCSVMIGIRGREGLGCQRVPYVNKKRTEKTLLSPSREQRKWKCTSNARSRTSPIEARAA